MLADRYRIVGRLGKGGMGEVYRADDMKLGQPVALKFLPETFKDGSSMLARFHHEVKIARQVSHTNVCRVYDIAEFEGQHFLSMEYVDGEDLSSLLRRIGRLPGDKALQIARQLCAGLAAAHEKGVLHRDLKPANVMLDGSGRVRITDFGLAALADEIQQSDVRAGTPAYMAPEQREGKEVSVASDIYSLGLVLFELFTGKPAYTGNSRAELAESQRQDVTSPSSHVQDIDPSVERVILGCMARHPTERPSSALAVAAALPGGDPLAAALAAGETPSPEMVAASVVKGALRPALAWALLAGIIVCTAGMFFLADKGKVTSHVQLAKEPQVLIAEARNILAATGHDQEPADHIWGFEINRALLNHLEKLETMDRWAGLGRRENTSVMFYYRQAPDLMLPLAPLASRMSLRDPPPSIPGTATVWLDTEGHLVRMEILPPEKSAPAGDPLEDSVWQPLFAAADIDPAGMRAVEPEWNPYLHNDHQFAWVQAEDDGPGFRVEAASYRGRPVFFRVVAPWELPYDPVKEAASLLERIASFVVLAVTLTVLIGGFLLARRNVRLGRSDRRGAFRIASVFIVLHMVAWLLYAKHPASLDDTFFAMIATLAISLFEGMVIYTLYLALEPYIRRRWPDTIVSWTRALSGRFRDPLVGRDILFGCGLGLLVALFWELGQIAPEYLGEVPRRPDWVNLHSLAANRFVFGEILDRLVHAIVPSMALLTLLLFITLVVKRIWIAGLVLMGVFVILGMANFGYWFDIIGMLVTMGLIMVCLVRLGLLSATVLFAVSGVVDVFVITTNLSAWYSTGTIVALVFILAVALYGFWIALAGRPLFGSGWLDE
jgi:hypothetical protein